MLTLQVLLLQSLEFPYVLNLGTQKAWLSSQKAVCRGSGKSSASPANLP